MPEEVQASPSEVELLAGVPEGEEVINSAGKPTGEKVVADYDDAGNVSGWHKEAV